MSLPSGARSRVRWSRVERSRSVGVEIRHAGHDLRFERTHITSTSLVTELLMVWQGK